MQEFLRYAFFAMFAITYIYMWLGTPCIPTEAIKWEDTNTLWSTSIISENDCNLETVSKGYARICFIYWGWSFEASKLFWFGHSSSSISACNRYKFHFFLSIKWLRNFIGCLVLHPSKKLSWFIQNMPNKAQDVHQMFLRSVCS